MARNRVSTQLLTGVVVVIVGVLLLLETTDIYDVDVVWQFVPSLFVLVGAWTLVKSDFRNVLGPAIVILVAGTLQLFALDLLPGDAVSALGPLIVIAVGLSILASHWRRRRSPATAGDEFDLFGIFGGPERRVTSRSFRGGSAMALFGGVSVDLREAEVADPPAVVTATAMFGGIELDVSEEWRVEIDALPIFGGVSDDRPPAATTGSATGEPDLLVTGFVAFGGITIK